MLRKQPRIIRHEGSGDAEFYWKRLVRNHLFLGVDQTQQRASQEKLRKSVAGVAGYGGLGSYLAVQLARIGIGHIKICDPDHFEESNINRQLGSGAHTIGKDRP